MATLTLEVPDTVAQTVARLSEADRAAYLAHMNALAVASLPRDNDEANDEDDLPSDIFLIQALGDDMREAREAITAGQVIDGDTFLADLRRRASENRSEGEAGRITTAK